MQQIISCDSLFFYSKSDEWDSKRMKVLKNTAAKAHNIEAELAGRAVDFLVKHNAINSLLTILIVSNSKDIHSTIKSGTHYVNIGLKNHISLMLFNAIGKKKPSLIMKKLSWNIDGLPLFKNANTSLWPILFWSNEF